jgi:hypothetical protein
MGRKGVSKRKPKKTNTGSNDNIHGSASARPGQSSVQSLVNARNAPPTRGGTNPSTGSNKKIRNEK